MVEIVQREQTVAEANPGEHRIVLAKEPVRRDVNPPALWAVLLQNLLGRLGTKEDLRLRNNLGNGLKLFIDGRRLTIRHAQNQGATGLIYLLPAMLHVNARTRRIRNRERIDQISVSVKKRVKRHVMEQLVRNYDQATSLQPWADGGH